VVVEDEVEVVAAVEEAGEGGGGVGEDINRTWDLRKL
jgi:hypothetical protein